MMRKTYPIFIPVMGIFLLFFLLASCSKGKVSLSDDGLKARQINQMVEDLRTAYLKKDGENLAVHFAPDGAIPPEAIREEVNTLYQKTEPVTLVFFIERIVLGEQSSKVYVHWEGEWREKDKGRARVKRGNAVFLLHGDSKPLVLDIQGDSFLKAEGTELR